MRTNIGSYFLPLTILMSLPAGPALPQENITPQTSIQEPAWGASISDFKTAQGSKLTFAVEKMNARPLDYLLMGFHDVAKDDPDRAPKFSVQTIPGDDTLYIFYDGRLCAASVTLALPDVMDKFHQLNSLCKKAGYYTQRALTGFYGYHGSETVFFHHSLYVKDPSTWVDLVDVTGYYDDNMYYGKSGADAVQTEEGELIAGYLVYVSIDYLKGPNAYTEWQENQKNASPPKVDPIQRFKCSIEH